MTPTSSHDQHIATTRTKQNMSMNLPCPPFSCALRWLTPTPFLRSRPIASQAMWVHAAASSTSSLAHIFGFRHVACSAFVFCVLRSHVCGLALTHRKIKHAPPCTSHPRACALGPDPQVPHHSRHAAARLLALVQHACTPHAATCTCTPHATPSDPQIGPTLVTWPLIAEHRRCRAPLNRRSSPNR